MQVKPFLFIPAFLFLLLSSNAYPVQAPPQAPQRSVFEALTAEEAAPMTLELDLTSLLENRKTNQYFPAMLSSGAGKNFQVEVKPRGKYRRKICAMPPLKIKFSKKGLRAEGLDTLNEIKLVLPCYNDPNSEELIVREYLAYRMFEQLSPNSVRARLVKLTLKDSHVEKSRRPIYALLLEDEEETCARLHGRMLETYGLPADSLVADQAALVAMFEYMIGNTDWDISMLRNVRLLQTEPGGKVLALPYDFDFSGLVGAPYASPSSESGLRNVRDRFLMAGHLPPDALRRATATLQASHKNMLSLCRSKHFSKSAASDMINYLETFFEVLDVRKDVPTTFKFPVD